MYRCPLCHRLFESLATLKIHFKYWHSDGPCPICGKTMKNMTQHIWRSHPEALHILYLYIRGHTGIPREVKEKAYKMAEEAFRA